MSNTQVHTGRRTLIVLALCAVALAVFYFADLPIAQAVYQPDTVFGWFFDILSPSIAPTIGLFLLCALLTTDHAQTGRGWGNRLAQAIETVLAAACAWIAVAQFDKYAELDLPTYMIGLIAIAYLALMTVLTWHVKPDREALQQLVISAIVMIMVVLLLTEGIKSIWGRRRFWSMDDPATQFTPWLFPQGNGAEDVYRSFPSGHTANGCAILLVLLFPRAFPVLRKVRSLLTAFIAIWVPLMAFSRMVEGMHFASDVTFGFTIAFTVFSFVSSNAFARWTAPLARKL